MKAARIIGYVACAVELVALFGTFVPLVHTQAWWIRIADYPRLQFAFVLTVTAIVAAVCLRQSPWLWRSVLIAALAGIGFNLAKVLPFTPVGRADAGEISSCASQNQLHVLSANLHVTNRQSEKVLSLVREVNPDLALFMETDGWWHNQLAALQQQYPYHVEHVEHGPYGMELFSRHKLVDPQVKFYIAPDDPSIITGVQLSSGAEITFIGIHPRPPARDQTALFRDTVLMHAALAAHGESHAVVLAGDLNSVPWERIIGRLCRLAGFLDPRKGRELVNTYGVQNPALRWPLDYVLYQKDFLLQDFRRLKPIGSDHFPVEARLCYAPQMSAKNHPPDPLPDDAAEANRILQAGAALAARIRP